MISLIERTVQDKGQEAPNGIGDHDAGGGRLFQWVFDWSTWLLSMAAWAFLLLGFAIQFLVLKLCRTLWKRRLFPGLVVLGIVAGELACQMITGWELLAVLVLYGCVFSLAIGAVLAFAVYCVAEHSKG